MRFGATDRDQPAPQTAKIRQGLPKVSNVLNFLRTVMKLSHGQVLRYLTVIAVMQAINGLLVIPAIKALFMLALKVGGLNNITDRTYTQIFSHPLMLLLLLAIAIIALAAVSLQFSALVVMVNRQQAGKSLRFKAIAGDTFRSLTTLLRYPSPLLAVYFFLALPLGGLGLSSVLIQGVSIPPFITREYLKVPLSTFFYALIIGAIIYVNLRLILTLPLLVVGRKKPYLALGGSIKATHKNFVRYLLLIGIPLVISALSISLIVELLVWLSTLAATSFETETAAVISALCVGAGNALGFLIIGAATVVVIQVLVALTRERLGHPIKLVARDAKPRRARTRVTRVSVGTIVFGLVVSGGFYGSPAMGQTVSGAEDTVILAHRGYQEGGVENTLGGLKAAADAGADYVEADFQETRDGYFIASHDTNLFMLSGQSKNIYDLTLKEAREITVSEGGFSDSIPTMEEYLKRADELNLPVLVELKVTGHESSDFLQRFFAQLEDSGTTEQNIYHSLNADAVNAIKKWKPQLRVGLTVALSAGDLSNVNCDFYTIEQSSFNEELLHAAHDQGKEVYVWTVNDESTIRKMLSIPVDGIVTDNVEVALQDRELIANNPAADYSVGYALAYLDLFR